MYIYAYCNYEDTIVDVATDKKALLEKRFNRTDNFINLTLYGLQNTIKSLDKDSAVYLASPTGNLNSTLKTCKTICIDNKLPSPFTFLNSVPSITLFYIAKWFGLEGKMIFVDSFRSGFIQAYCDIKMGFDKPILVGIVSEAIEDLELHKTKFDTQKVIEKSKWVVIAKRLNGHNPLMKIDEDNIMQIDESLFDVLAS